MRRPIWNYIIYGLVLLLIITGIAVYAFREQLHLTASAHHASPVSPDQISIALNGAQEVILEHGSVYEELGATAQFTASDGTVTNIPVLVQGSVDGNRFSNQLVLYTAQYGDAVQRAYRYVRVVDTTAPVITLTADPYHYTVPYTPYIEEGFTAIDACDGNLTDMVIRTESNGVVTYQVTDFSGNTATVTRPIRYYDPSAPSLELLGGKTIVLLAGQPYVDPGYTAWDKYDFDLTFSVAVSGEVNNMIPGIYTTQYTVTNGFGNTTTDARTVYVVPPDLAPSTIVGTPLETGGTAVEPNGKVIYLTFDDGPSGYTPRLLDTLARYHVKASFFVVNTSRIDIIKRTAAEGHTVAIHSYTHDYAKIYKSDDAFFADLYAMQDVIYNLTGQRPVLTRFPGGSSNTRSLAYNKGIMTRLAQKLTEMGYQYFDWNVSSGDAGGAYTAEAVYNNVVNGVSGRSASVVLQHDIKGFSVDAVEKILVWGICNGYSFQPLTFDSPTYHHGIRN